MYTPIELTRCISSIHIYQLNSPRLLCDEHANHEARSQWHYSICSINTLPLTLRASLARCGAIDVLVIPWRAGLALPRPLLFNVRASLARVALRVAYGKVVYVGVLRAGQPSPICEDHEGYKQQKHKLLQCVVVCTAVQEPGHADHHPRTRWRWCMHQIVAIFPVPGLCMGRCVHE